MNEKSNNANTTSGQGSESSPAPRDQAAMALRNSVATGAQEVGAGVKHLASDVAGQARHTAESQLTVGKTRAAEGLGSVADALRKTGEQLRAEDKGPLTEYLDRAAHQVDVASGYLQSRSLAQVMGDVEQFARREPALFLGGAFVAGLVGGRFLKSTGSQSSASTTKKVGEQGQQNRQQPAPQQSRSQRPTQSQDRRPQTGGASNSNARAPQGNPGSEPNKNGASAKKDDGGAAKVPGAV